MFYGQIITPLLPAKLDRSFFQAAVSRPGKYILICVLCDSVVININKNNVLRLPRKFGKSYWGASMVIYISSIPQSYDQFLEDVIKILPNQLFHPRHIIIIRNLQCISDKFNVILIRAFHNSIKIQLICLPVLCIQLETLSC